MTPVRTLPRSSVARACVEATVERSSLRSVSVDAAIRSGMRSWLPDRVTGATETRPAFGAFPVGVASRRVIVKHES